MPEDCDLRSLDVRRFQHVTDDEQAAMLKWFSERGCYDIIQVEEQYDGSLMITTYVRGDDGNLMKCEDDPRKPVIWVRKLPGDDFPWPEPT